MPDRVGNGSGELIVLLTTIAGPVADARADELAAAYHERWEQETGHDQLKTHLRGPGRVLRSRLPDLVRQEIWAWLIVHYAMAALITRAAEAADIDPDRVSFTRTLRLIRRTATGTAAFPPDDWAEGLPQASRPQITPEAQPPPATPHLPPRGETAPAQQLPGQTTRRTRCCPSLRMPMMASS